MMTLLLDSCVSRYAVNGLRESGYDAVWVPDFGKDPGDRKIMEWALNEGRILVTLDKDFGELVFVFNEPHPPLIRLVDIRPMEQAPVLMSVLKQYENILLNDNPIITVEDDRIRIRTQREESR